MQIKTATFSCFCEKEVVNCRDGKIIGCPIDLKFDFECGQILSFFVRDTQKGGLFSKAPLLEIAWDKIQKIGEDIILVDLDFTAPPPEKPKKEKKIFFGGPA